MPIRSKPALRRSRTGPSARLVAAAVCFTFLLAGCVGEGAESGGGDPAAPKTAATTAKATESAPETPVPPAPPPDLMGKKRTEVIELLGRPAFSRRDQPALLLRYRQDGCILDLFLYPEPGANAGEKASDQAVEHIEARSITGRKMTPNNCIAAIIKARSAKKPG